MKDEVRQQYITRIAAFAKRLKPDGLRMLYRLAASLLRTQKMNEGREGKE